VVAHGLVKDYEMNSSKKDEPARPQGRPRTFDEDAVLDAATSVFLEKGYEAASLDELTAATGLNRSSLYHAFGDKRGLFLKVIERYGSTLGSAPVAALNGGLSLPEDLRNFLDTVVDNATRRGGPTGCLFTCTLPEVASVDDEVRAALRAVCRDGDAAVAARIQLAVDQGELPASTPVEALAAIVVSLMHSLSIRARAGVPRAELKRLAQQSLALIATSSRL
jgi:AcrR family transcriptional regulator